MTKTKSQQPDKLEIVTARAEKSDLDLLKKNNVNISKTIRKAIAEAANRYR